MCNETEQEHLAVVWQHKTNEDASQQLLFWLQWILAIWSVLLKVKAIQ